jgi:DNA invertase Pin-like site-specific DNA recombinase
MKYAYVRVSTRIQCEERQLVEMDSLGIPHERIFVEKLSGKDTKRPQLQKLLRTVKRGDTVVVGEISRFARNARDLLNLVEQLTEKGVDFISKKECIDTTTVTGRFMLTVLGAVAEMERGYMLQRQADGIAAAKTREVRFGRPLKCPPDDFAPLVNQWECGDLHLADLLEQTGMTRATVHRRQRDYRADAVSYPLPPPRVKPVTK